MTVNKKYLRIFLIFMVLFGAYQLYDIYTVRHPGGGDIIGTGVMMLVGVVIVSALWFLKNVR